MFRLIAAAALTALPLGAAAQELNPGAGSPLDTPSGLMIAICAGTLSAYADQRAALGKDDAAKAAEMAAAMTTYAVATGDPDYPDGLAPMIDDAKAEAAAVPTLGEDAPDLSGAGPQAVFAHRSLENCRTLVDHLEAQDKLPQF